MRNSILFVKDNLESYQKVAICLTKQTHYNPGYVHYGVSTFVPLSFTLFNF